MEKLVTLREALTDLFCINKLFRLLKCYIPFFTHWNKYAQTLAVLNFDERGTICEPINPRFKTAPYLYRCTEFRVLVSLQVARQQNACHSINILNIFSEVFIQSGEMTCINCFSFGQTIQKFSSHQQHGLEVLLWQLGRPWGLFYRGRTRVCSVECVWVCLCEHLEEHDILSSDISILKDADMI